MTALEPILALLCVAALAGLLTLLLRLAGLSRAAVAAGMVAGVLAGSTIFGRVMPQWHERLFVGGAAERGAIEAMRGEQGAHLTALRATGVSDAAINELQAGQVEEMAAALVAHDAAMRAHQSGRILISAILALALIVAAMPRSRLPGRWSECAFAALWMLVVVCAIVGLAVVFALDDSRAAALALGLSFACVGTSVILPLSEGETSNETVVIVAGEWRDRLVNTALLIWFICFVAAFAALLTADRWAGPLAAHAAIRTAPAGIILGLVLGYLPRRWRHALRMIILPSTLAALLLLTADLLTTAIIAPLVLALIVGGDARWLGLASALRWLGRPWRESWVATMPLIDAGPMQAAMGGLFFLAGWLNAPLFACALFGAIVCDVMQPLRPRLVTMLNDQTEDESRSS